MVAVLKTLLWAIAGRVISPADRDAELIALRHQVDVLRRKSPKRIKLTCWDRFLFALLYRLQPRVLGSITIVKPETVIRWHRRGFRLYWRWKSRSKPGRPRTPKKIRELIREVSIANPLWGAPRIHGGLLKLGFDVSQATVAKYMAKGRRPPSQSWKTFLRNHADGIAAVDLFVVPTVTFKLLFCFLILQHDRRRLVHFAVTSHPCAEWLARQIVEAFPWETTPDYLVRDRDGAYGGVFQRRLRGMGIRDRPTAPRSPWRNGLVERLIGSIRRECLDHVIVINEAHLRRCLREYADYYNRHRTHLSLAKDAPISRPVRRVGKITPMPHLGGSHVSFSRI